MSTTKDFNFGVPPLDLTYKTQCDTERQNSRNNEELSKVKLKLI